MYRRLTVEKDRERLLEYWRDEQTAPEWYHRLFDRDQETFLSFCSRHTIYEVGNALIYCEKMSPTITQIHLSVLRGTDCKTLYKGFLKLRDDLFKETQIIFGLIYRLNFPVMRLFERFGFHKNGLCLDIPIRGMCHTEYCFAADRREFFGSKTN